MNLTDEIKINNYKLFENLLSINKDQNKLIYIAAAKDGIVVNCYVVQDGKIYEINSTNLKYDAIPLKVEKFHRFVSDHAMDVIEDARSRSYSYYLLFEENFIDGETYKIYKGIRFGPKAGRGYLYNYLYQNQQLIQTSKEVNWFA